MTERRAAMSPIDYRPRAASDFIGPAAVLARTLSQVVARTKAKGAPIKILIHGDPGIGKSALHDLLTSQIAEQKWSVTKLNGVQFKKEVVDDWASRLCFRELG